MKKLWRILWWLLLIGGGVMLVRKLRQSPQQQTYQPQFGSSTDGTGAPARTMGTMGTTAPTAPTAPTQPAGTPGPTGPTTATEGGMSVPATPVPVPDSPAAVPAEESMTPADRVVVDSGIQLEPEPEPAGLESLGEPQTVADKDMPDEPPPPPEPPPLVLSTRSLEGVVGTEQARQLWLALQQENYRHRGEGFHADWAFPQFAIRHDLGAPLAPTTRITIGGKRYVFQPFARATIFNEIPHWSDVQNLNDLMGGSIPETGLAHELLDASFGAGGALLQTDWAFHQLAVREQLGPPLMDSRRISVGGKEYSTQVFACDTLYCEVPNWQDVRRLSETAAGDLADALWAEAYRPCGTAYQSDTPAHQLASKEQLGTPLSGLYQIDFEGHTFDVQVFARDTVIADPGGEFMLQSQLDRPDRFNAVVSPGLVTVIGESGNLTREEALSDKRPLFAMLPVAGQPRISQFYGYTRWAAGDGRKYYGQCQGRHPGIDFAVPVGTPLLSVAHGVVVYAGPTARAPFGGSPPQIAIVRYGSLYVIYGHSSEVLVSKGQRVTPGQVVTLSGSYGGPHLHFEVRPVPQRMLANDDPDQPGENPGYTVNPLDYFNDEMNAYFDRWYHTLGGDSHFCRGSLRNQERIVFAGAVDTRPCAN